MDKETQKASKFSINLEIDKLIYKNRDQVRGYVEFNVSEKVKQRQNTQIQYRLQLSGIYTQLGSEIRNSDNLFIIKIHQTTHENYSFSYNLDLITTTAFIYGGFWTSYCIGAIIIVNDNKKFEKLKNFLVYIPYVDIQRPIQMEKHSQIKNIFCCKYGQIQVRASLQKQDFQINDVAQIQIEFDSSLSSKNIHTIQANLISTIFFYDQQKKSSMTSIFKGIKFEGIQTKKFQKLLELQISCQDDQMSNKFQQSCECLFASHRYFIQIICNTGIFTESIQLEIPIIIYHNEYQQMYINTDQEAENALQIKFDPQTYTQFKDNNFIEMNICQYKWQKQGNDFLDMEHHDNQEVINNMIKIQQRKQ